MISFMVSGVSLPDKEEPIPSEQPATAFLQPGLQEHHQPGLLLQPHLHPDQACSSLRRLNSTSAAFNLCLRLLHPQHLDGI